MSPLFRRAMHTSAEYSAVASSSPFSRFPRNLRMCWLTAVVLCSLFVYGILQKFSPLNSIQMFPFRLFIFLFTNSRAIGNLVDTVFSLNFKLRGFFNFFKQKWNSRLSATTHGHRIATSARRSWVRSSGVACYLWGTRMARLDLRTEIVASC